MLRIAMLTALAAGPALGADDYGFFSLRNTDFVVLLAFLGFLALLYYLKVHERLGGMLDRRAESIRSELDEARAIREEAQTLLASYERKTREAQAQSERIVAQAREEAEAAAEQARADLDAQVARRIEGAEEQIAQAEAAAIAEIRREAARIAVEAAGEVIAQAMDDERRASLVDGSIDTVGAKLH